MNERIERLPKYKGFPIPFFATTMKDGTPDFKIIHQENRILCAMERRCWVCGEGLEYWITFVGGPVSTKYRTYNDGPMHPECARDSMEICPFLLGQMDYADNFRPDLHEDPQRINFVTGYDRRPEQKKNPPERLALLLCRGFKILNKPEIHTWFFKADNPKSIEWRDRKLRKEAS